MRIPRVLRKELIILCLFTSFSYSYAQKSVFFAGETFYQLTEEAASRELYGNFYIYRPPVDLGGIHAYDSDDGVLGFIISPEGLDMKRTFAETIHTKGDGNYNGSIPEYAYYSDGKWYKALHDGKPYYLYKNYSCTIRRMHFWFGQWDGTFNEHDVASDNEGLLIVRDMEKDCWFYVAGNTGYPFKRVNGEENEYWEKSQDDINGIYNYLSLYPDGAYVNEANERIEEYNQWIEAEKINTIQSYNDYIVKYPNSNYINNAKYQIALLEDDANWETAKRINTLSSYRSYLNGNGLKRYEVEAKKGIRTIEINKDNARWEKIKESSTVSDFTSYLSSNGYKGHIKEATDKKHLLTARQTTLTLESALQILSDYNSIEAKQILDKDDENKLNKAEEMVAYSWIKEKRNIIDAKKFLDDYPQSEFYNEISDILAIKLADGFREDVTKEQYNQALRYAVSKDGKQYVTSHYRDNRRVYSKKNGTPLSFGLELMYMESDVSRNREDGYSFLGGGASLTYGKSDSWFNYEMACLYGDIDSATGIAIIARPKVNIIKRTDDNPIWLYVAPEFGTIINLDGKNDFLYGARAGVGIGCLGVSASYCPGVNIVSLGVQLYFKPFAWIAK